KLPSPVVNPATQKGEGISLSNIKGLFTASISENLTFNYSDKPQFNEALKDKTFFKPSNVKCSLFIIKLTISLNNL
ncbi:hypothetical protein K491DRAFT_672570, partial [Lophiostoma macrostomum CBS 122681]